MPNSLSRIALRAAYCASQLPRVAWYIGHGLAVRRLAKAVVTLASAPTPVRLCRIAGAFMPIWLFFFGKTLPT
jgi:hypothetical protein